MVIRIKTCNAFAASPKFYQHNTASYYNLSTCYSLTICFEPICEENRACNWECYCDVVFLHAAEQPPGPCFAAHPQHTWNHAFFRNEHLIPHNVEWIRQYSASNSCGHGYFSRLDQNGGLIV